MSSGSDERRPIDAEAGKPRLRASGATPRALASIWSAKAAAYASRALGRGGGTAVSGVVALSIEPRLVACLSRQLGHGSVVVTGTNGKTTTSRLLTEVARIAGLSPLANASGSNLMRGIAATLALEAEAGGSIPDAGRRLGVFEVDEATLPLALPALRPRAAVFINLFRDQLDRYGEVEAVAALWRDALATAPAVAPRAEPRGMQGAVSDMRIVLNADDPAVASLGEDSDAIYFGVNDPAHNRGRPEHASDALNCRCGARLVYDIAYFGHIGHWRCQACDRSRPSPQVSARDVELRDGRSLRFRLVLPSGETTIEMQVGGLYNVYNALAAAAASVALGLPEEAIGEALSATSAAFGRQESFEVDGRRVELFLGKNPAGLNQVLATLMLDPARRAALVILNDRIADGRDISWVWDADFEVAAGRFETAVVSGTRAEEMALRLKYAEWPQESLVVEPDIEKALDLALNATATGAALSVVPTYTAMLEVRELLAKRAGRPSFWREAGPDQDPRLKAGA